MGGGRLGVIFGSAANLFEIDQFRKFGDVKSVLLPKGVGGPASDPPRPEGSPGLPGPVERRRRQPPAHRVCPSPLPFFGKSRGGGGVGEKIQEKEEIKIQSPFLLLLEVLLLRETRIVDGNGLGGGNNPCVSLFFHDGAKYTIASLKP